MANFSEDCTHPASHLSVDMYDGWVYSQLASMSDFLWFILTSSDLTSLFSVLKMFCGNEILLDPSNMCLQAFHQPVIFVLKFWWTNFHKMLEGWLIFQKFFLRNLTLERQNSCILIITTHFHVLRFTQNLKLGQRCCVKKCVPKAGVTRIRTFKLL